MPNMLATGSAFLIAKLREHASTAIVYSRGVATVSVSAVVGRTERELNDGTGAVHRWTARDYLILATDLVLSGNVTEPQEGDRISETMPDASVRVHEVRGAFGGSAPWEWSDPAQTTLRIHTAYLGVAA